MTNEQIVEWLGKFGKDWVSFKTANGDGGVAVHFLSEAESGYLEYRTNTKWDDPECLRITDKAIQQLNERK